MRFTLLRHLLSSKSSGPSKTPSGPRLYLAREEGMAAFVTRRSALQDELVSCLPDGKGTPFTVEGRDATAYGVIAPIPHFCRGLRSLGWGKEHVQAPPQPAPRRAPQRRPTDAQSTDA